MPLTLKPQEIAFDDPRSTCFFDQSSKLFLKTRGALDTFGIDTILRCLVELQYLAEEKNGLDYLQVFVDETTGQKLFLIEDGEGSTITAMLPEEY